MRVAIREVRPPIVVRQIQRYIVHRRALAQHKTRTLKIRSDVGHHDPPRILLIKNRSSIEAPTRILDTFGSVGPTVSDELIDSHQEMTIGFSFHVERRRTKDW